MSNTESPAGASGGPVVLPGLDDLPEKLRVHALAKLLGRTSREVLATLAELGIPVSSAQSSVDRKAAEQVALALAPEGAIPEPPQAPEADDAPADPGLPAPSFADDGGDRAAADAAAAEGAPVVAALAPLFAPPAPVFQPPARRTRRRGAAADDAEPAAEVVDASATDEPPVEAGDADETVEERAEAGGDDESAEGDGGRRRRRRGRRGRGRGRGGEGDLADAADDADEADEPTEFTEPVGNADDQADEETDESDADTADDAADAEGGSRRRRRRRRRRGTGDDTAVDDETDPPNTVVRVRAPRERSDDTDGDGVQGVRGSTRLEAKRQRRRDGRDAGRRRVPILTEAEFLARRESVDRSMVVRERGDRIEVGVLEDGVLVEHFITDGGAGQNGSLVGNMYLGRVQNVLPSMEAAFVDIGRGRNAVLYAGEVDWDAAGLGGRARRIEQALSSGDSVLVQVTKDPVGHKGARLTTQVSLAGRFLVYVPSGGAAGISRKLPDVERKRLKDVLKEIVPTEAGVIIRTASEGVSQEALERDVRRLQAQWEVVKEKSEKTRTKAPVLLYEEPDMLIKVIRDQFNEDFSRLVVEGDDAWETVANYVGHVAPELSPRLHRHVGPRDVFEEYRIDEQLLKALDRKVWLPSGGTLVIDRTEAMTVIDVNTGKFTGSGGNLEETVTRNNLEAAEEIVRQLRLRDIGGIIVIDFIDMVLEANRDLVLRRLTECLARDRTRHQVAEVTSLGLVQMTRKRVGGGLLEHFSTPCEHCRGRGVIVTTEPVGEPSGRNDRNGDSGGRRSRGRGRRDEPGGAGRRLPEAITPDRTEASVDVGAPAPVAEEEPDGPVVPATVESAQDDVEEVVVEQSLAAERTRHRTVQSADAAPAAEPETREPDTAEPDTAEPDTAEPDTAEPDAADALPAPDPVGDLPVAGNGAGTLAGETAPVEAADGVSGANGAGPATTDEPAGSGRTRRRGRVTRTAGAPAATAGDTPAVAVVTVPVRPVASDPTPDSPPEAQPDLTQDSTPDATLDSAPDSTPDTDGPVPAAEPAVEARPRRARRAASRPAGPPAAEGGGDPV
jgi:ribonuclease E